MKEEMIKRAKAINQLLDEKGYGFHIQHESMLKNNCYRDIYKFDTEENFYNVLPLLNYDDSWWKMSNLELVEFLHHIFIENAYHLEDQVFFSREYILNYVLPKIVSKTNMAAFLKEKIICVPVLDMILTFYLPVKDKEDSVLSIKITEEFLQKVSCDELKNAAIGNVEKTYRIETIESILEEAETGVSEYSEESYPMYVLTNNNRINGAATILSKNIMWDLSQQMGSKNIILLPFSVHEFVAIPFSERLQLPFLLELVQDANDHIANIEDKLTDSIYIWRAGKFTVLH